MNIDRLLLGRAGARVQRLHTLPPIYRQSDGEHTFGVINIMLEVCPGITREALIIAQRHDICEAASGDIPSPVLHFSEQIAQGVKSFELTIHERFDLGKHHAALNDFERKVLRFSDRMELAMFSMEELDMGNRTQAKVCLRVLNMIKRDCLIDVTPEASQLYDYVRGTFEFRGYDKIAAEKHFHDTPDYT